MGACNFPKKSSNPKPEINNRQNEMTKKEIIKSNSIIDQKKEIDKFKDFEEYENYYSGFGIKRMKAYKTNLTFDELQKLKSEFWSSKKENKRNWQILKQCCETDAYSAKEILAAAQLEVLDNCIKSVIDSSGIVYNLPNFLINDPLFIKEYDKLKGIENKEQKLTIYLIDVFKNTNYKVEALNSRTGKDIKLLFCEIMNLHMNNYKIRLLSKGHEILDEHLLYYHNLDENNNKVQVTYRPLEMDEILEKNVDNFPPNV